MKLLKRLGLGILALLLLLAIFSLFISSRLRVERSIEVAAPADAAFEQVNTLRNWERWSPWHGIDPHMLLTYSGPDGGAGASYNWFSKHPDVGDGQFKITKTEPYKFIVAEMNFGPNGTANTTYSFDKTAKGTRITWAMESELGMNPVSKYMGIFLIDDVVGADFERGLNNIKQIVESQPAGQQDAHAGHGH
ncbi:SRPBCC family protein [Pontibacter sp. KCTC 32443]|uniref:SRPBCC family protein n=1 Tax=Pontibacter TaxID=323449 RepID=UPI00164CF396|nr:MULTISPECIES: SRPBCC family protein [Pontibacter]MBC5773204.1 SRPBCC family protein [Pontibacter sp. KCTC 32443]